MIPDKIYLNTPRGQEIQATEVQRKKIFRGGLVIALILVLVVGGWKAYDVFWLRHRYLITAYCDCPICVNIPAFRDSKFASKRHVYWGGVAADKKVPFGSSVELVPFTIRDWFSVKTLLDGRRQFKVEDRGGKIRGRHIDLFIPQSMGGHEKALRWGVRRMRLKINGQLMD